MQMNSVCLNSLLALSTLSSTAFASSPGPICDDIVLEQHRVVNLVAGTQKTRFNYPVRGGGYKIAPAITGTSERNCQQNAGSVSCEDWRELKRSEPKALAFYLDVVAGTYTPAIYGFTRGKVRLSHSDFSTTSTLGFSAEEAMPLAQLEQFTTRPYEYSFSVNGAGHANSHSTGPKFQGTVRNSCAKFWSIAKTDVIDFGGGLSTWTEQATFYYSEY